MRKNRDRKLVGIYQRRSLVIRIGDDYSRNRKSLKLARGKRDRIDNIETVGASNRRGKEVGLCRGIVGLPDPKVRGKLLKIGGRHKGQNAWIKGVRQGGGIVGALVTIENIE